MPRLSVRRSAVSIVLLTFAAASLAAEEPTGLEYVKRLQTVPLNAILQYCRERAPEAEQAISEGHAHMLGSLEQAMEVWIAERPEMKQSMLQRLPAGSKERVEVEQQMRELQTLAKKSTDSIRQYDPHAYCPWVAKKFQEATPATLLKSLHDYDERVAAKVRQMGQ